MRFKFPYKLWSWSCAFWTSAKPREFSYKEDLVQNWRKFDVEVFAENLVAPIDRDNPENVWNNVLMNDVSYVDKDHPLKTKYVRNHTVPFFDDELKTMKKSRKNFEKAYRKNGNSQDKSRFINSVLEYFELFTRKKSTDLDKCVASENERVWYAMLQQLLWKSIVFLPQSLGEPECLAKKSNASFAKKIETVLVSIPLKNGFKIE